MLVAEEPEPFVEVVEDLRGAEGAHPRGGQLDGERHPVEPARDLGDRHEIAVVQLDPWVGGDGPFREQPCGGGGRAVRVQWRYRLALLAFDAERLPAGCEHPQRGRGVEQSLDEGRGRLEQVLAVVDDQQHVAPGQVVRDAHLRRLVRFHLQVEAAHEGGDDLAFGGGLRQVDEEDPVGEVRQLTCRGLDRDPGLACAAGAEERHQLGGRDQSVDAADELAPDRRTTSAARAGW